MERDWRMNGKEKILDIFRKLYFRPVVYCLYEKTRKRQLQWKKDEESWARTTEESGIQFTLEYHYDPSLSLTDLETLDRIGFYSSRGVESLFELVKKIEGEPVETYRKARLAKYLQENC